MPSDEKLAKYIEERGISRAELSERSGVGLTTIWRMLHQDRYGTLDTWLRIAEALNCRISDILGE